MKTYNVIKQSYRRRRDRETDSGVFMSVSSYDTKLFAVSLAATALNTFNWKLKTQRQSENDEHHLVPCAISSILTP